MMSVFVCVHTEIHKISINWFLVKLQNDTEFSFQFSSSTINTHSQALH